MGNKTLIGTVVIGFGLGLGLSSFEASPPPRAPVENVAPSAPKLGSAEAPNGDERSRPTSAPKSGEAKIPVDETFPVPEAWKRLASDAKEIWAREDKIGGVLRRERILETRFKFPLVRVEDEIRGDGTTRLRSVSVADHMLVKLASARREGEVDAFLREHSLRLRKRLPGQRLILVAFESERPERYQEVLALLKTRSDLFERVDRDDIALRD